VVPRALRIKLSILLLPSSNGPISYQCITKHLENELGILEEVLKLEQEEAKAFLEWYLNHPYTKGILEVLEIVKGGRRDRKTQTNCT
jgi:hypothetical protein